MESQKKVVLGCALVLVSLACVSAEVVEHTFLVGNVTVAPLCDRPLVITAVNGSLPGPTINVTEGDTVVVLVLNQSPYNMTIHWHGVFQRQSGWADGPEYVTQCPIMPGNNYTYKFNITEQEGTLWWHAHISYLRATVYGALVILPREGRSYPFPKPDHEVPLLLGEWWDTNVVDILEESSAVGGGPEVSDAFTINGKPGDLYNCSTNNTFRLDVEQGKTYLLRMVNAALQNILFFKVANHNFTVVAIDGCYTNPYMTETITIAPGQTMDVLFTANQVPGLYYMAAHAYMGTPEFVPFDDTTTTAIVAYDGATSSTPIMPVLPAFDDNATVFQTLSNFTGLTTAPFWVPVPQEVDERMFITVGLGTVPCDLPGNQTCAGNNGGRLAASLNNVSFDENIIRLSMLEASYYNVSGIYTTDFPDQPPVVFDYTQEFNPLQDALLPTTKGRKVRKFAYNTSVEIVFQNTALGTPENHPIHIHGFDFHVLAQGFGNYNASQVTLNLVNPHLRNTIAVPIGGWAVIRFRTNNPGVWFMHCHLEVHVPWGLAGAIEVENGPTPETSLPAPPADLPKC